MIFFLESFQWFKCFWKVCENTDHDFMSNQSIFKMLAVSFSSIQPIIKVLHELEGLVINSNVSRFEWVLCPKNNFFFLWWNDLISLKAKLKEPVSKLAEAVRRVSLSMNPALTGSHYPKATWHARWQF